MRFFDTNILVYAVTDQDPRKKRIANEVLSHALEVNHDGCISTQVLQEFCNTLLGAFSVSEVAAAERAGIAADEMVKAVESELADMVAEELRKKKENGRV